MARGGIHKGVALQLLGAPTGHLWCWVGEILFSVSDWPVLPNTFLIVFKSPCEGMDHIRERHAYVQDECTRQEDVQAQTDMHH